MRPSKPWEVLLGWVTAEGEREVLLGDAAEEFARRVVQDGVASARAWYRRQVLRSVAPGLLGRFDAFSAIPRRGDQSSEVVTMWLKDLQLAARMLLKRPGFAVTVVVTLSLGIGATTALFGVFRTVFLEPLSLPEAGELVVVMETAGSGCCGPASGPDYVDWVERNRVFSGMALLSPGSVNLTGLGEPERVYATSVTASAFDLLDVEPLMGRVLLPEDEAGAAVVVLSHGFWQRALGGDADVLGSTLKVNGTSLTMVGVMPPGFDVPSPWARTMGHEFYTPFEAEQLETTDRGSHSWPVIARLDEGVTKDAAQADMERIMRELAEEYPRTNAERSSEVFTVHEYLFGDVGRQLLLILAASGVVLLIASANVAGLQLARSAAREAEISLRAALGASRRALLRLLFSESLLLSVLGGTGGVLVAVYMVRGLRSVLPPTIPRIDAVGIDGLTLLFAVGVAVITAVLFGMIPALITSRTDLASGVKEGGYSTLAPRKERVRDYFIVGQIALGLVLINAAGLLVQSYAEIRRQEYGFEAEGTLSLALSARGPDYETPAGRQDFYERVAERISMVPGVRSAGVVSKLPLNGGTNGNVQVEGRPPRSSSDEGPLVEVSSVTGDYFAAAGIPLLAGRTLERSDSTTDAVGVLINRTMAEEVWPGEEPLGKGFAFDDDAPWLTVVGVVGDVRQWGVEQAPRSEAYFPYARGRSSSGFVIARIDGDPTTVVPDVRRAVLEVDPTQPPSDAMMMSERLENAFAQRRFYTTLIALFAGAALLLASAGIYGTVSYFVARRIREFGIRLALGAGDAGILRLVLIRGVCLAAWGVGIGLIGVWTARSVVDSLVYGVGTMDARTVVVGCLILAFVAVAASTVPAFRAVRVSPALAMRSE